MNLYAITSNNTVISLEIDLFDTAIGPTNVSINGNTYTRYKVTRPSSSDKSKSGLTNDGMSVIVKNGTTTVDTNTVPIDLLFKNLHKLKFNILSQTLTANTTEGYDIASLSVLDTKPLDTTIPLAFKRANTVVNLGRL